MANMLPNSVPIHGLQWHSVSYCHASITLITDLQGPFLKSAPLHAATQSNRWLGCDYQDYRFTSLLFQASPCAL